MDIDVDMINTLKLYLRRVLFQKPKKKKKQK